MIRAHLLFLFSCCQCSFHAYGQSAWELKKAKDGINVYTRASKDSKFNELKAVFDLKGDLSRLRYILEDVSHYPDWVYSTKSCSILVKKNSDDFIYYAEIAAPWPVSNRDYYSETNVHMDPKGNWMQIESHNLPGLYPPKKHLVRIPLLKADWTIRVLAGGMIHVEYQLRWDPGGSIPPWLANLFSVNGPYQSFSQLQKKMQVPGD